MTSQSTMRPVLFFTGLLYVALIVNVDASCPYARQRKSPAGDRFRSSAVTCNSTSKYRRADGKCNNLDNIDWGSAGTPFLRLLPPVYDDGVGMPRTRSANGDLLPNPRTISNNVHRFLNFTSKKYTSMVFQWGQFIDHDITRTPKVEVNEVEIMDCCSRTDSVLTDKTSPCFPIHVPKNDPFFNDGKCFNLDRSEAYPGTGINANDPREQYNANTAYIDGSMIYGNSDAEMDDLRDKSFKKGQLKVDKNDHLPLGNASACHHDPVNPQYYCFKAGDRRVNDFFGLGALQTLFLREHNRIASELATINTAWDDETLFQEARRIVIAELQVITFIHWLPQLFEPHDLVKYSLHTNSYKYDPKINPSFPNVFSSAAFRFGHSMVPDNFQIGEKVYKTVQLFKESKFVINNMHNVINSLINKPQQRADAWYADSIRNRLDETDSTAKDGLDLVSLNIQRGREHGLPPYNAWREYCGLGAITDFLADDSDFGHIQGRDMRNTYASVDDIDIYTGGVAEIPLLKGAVGPTYACLVGQTMKKLRDGDRLWWESTDPITGFTQEQRQQLRFVSLAKIICNNAGYDQDDEISPDIFKTGSRKHALLHPLRSGKKPCHRILGLDLTKWRV